MKIKIIIIAVAVLIGGGGYAYYKYHSSNLPTEQTAQTNNAKGNNQTNTTPTDNNKASDTAQQATNSTTKLPAEKQKDNLQDIDPAPINGEQALQPGTYTDYSSDALVAAKASNSRVILFFNASSCSVCRASDTDFLANLDKIPSDVVLLKTDYDSETALKEKYNVTYLPTFVQIDASGKVVTKWSGGGINDLLANIK